MTRRSSIASALSSLLVGLLLVVSAPAVNAGGPCGKYAPEHCEAMVAVANPIEYALATPAQSVHILAGSGLGLEQFEAIEGQSDALFLVAAPTAEAAHVQSGYAPENYEQMLTQQPSN
jgi:hypothetical protein